MSVTTLARMVSPAVLLVTEWLTRMGEDLLLILTKALSRRRW
jgi:hypothetical protein